MGFSVSGRPVTSPRWIMRGSCICINKEWKGLPGSKRECEKKQKIVYGRWGQGQDRGAGVGTRTQRWHPVRKCPRPLNKHTSCSSFTGTPSRPLRRSEELRGQASALVMARRRPSPGLPTHPRRCADSLVPLSHVVAAPPPRPWLGEKQTQRRASGKSAELGPGQGSWSPSSQGLFPRG